MNWPRLSIRGNRARKLELSRRYERLFSGQGSASDAKIVLAHLADTSGFYRVTPPGCGDVAFNEGKRAVFGVIFEHLNLTPEEKDALGARSIRVCRSGSSCVRPKVDGSRLRAAARAAGAV